MNRPIQATAMTSECVPNISARGRRRRIIRGVITLAITLAVFALLMRRHAAAPVFLVIAPLAALTALYFLQAKEKT